MKLNEGEVKLLTSRESIMRLAWWIKSIFVIPFFIWRKRKITITNRRIFYQSGGLLSSEERIIPKDKVQDISVRQSFLGRVFGYGVIRIETAGSSTTEIVLKNYAKANKIKHIIASW